MSQPSSGVADAHDKEGYYGPNVEANLQTTSEVERSMGSLSVQVEDICAAIRGVLTDRYGHLVGLCAEWQFGV